MKSLSIFNRNLRFIVTDTLCISIAWLGAYLLRFNLSFIRHEWLPNALMLLPIVVVIQLLLNWRYSLNRIMSRYVSIQDLIRIIKSVVVCSIICLCIFYFTGVSREIPRAVIPLYGLLAIAFLSGVRLVVRVGSEWRRGQFANKKMVLVVGAGQAGEGLIRDLRRSHVSEYDVVCVVDDDSKKKGLELHGVRVVGTTDDISELLQEFAIDLVFIAIPSLSSTQMRRLFAICNKYDKQVSTLPAITDIAEGRISTNLLRPIELEDLLDRNVNIPHLDKVKELIRNKVVLVTGGGGSIGSELCKQILAYNPKSLIICDHSEFPLYSILNTLKSMCELELIPYLCSVSNENDLNNLFEKHRPNIVFHAAAYKHVPMLESQVYAAAKNNVLGTYNVAKVSSEHKVEKFVLVSSDKAVNPTNVMGMTKRVAEFICQYFSKTSSTEFIALRFGNVLGSAGSVVPLFKKQLLDGGPITVTHPDITRYFMTIPEAVSLILKAMSVGESGDLFTLNMGKPIKIQFLAEKIIELSGKKLGEDIEIKYTGLRPGEKLYEELHYDFEEQIKVSEKLFLVNSCEFDIGFLELSINNILQKIKLRKDSIILDCLSDLVFKKQESQNENVSKLFDKVEV